MWPQNYFLSMYIISYISYIFTFIYSYSNEKYKEALGSLSSLIFQTISLYALYAGHFFSVWGLN
jgi:hypothetical protein